MKAFPSPLFLDSVDSTNLELKRRLKNSKPELGFSIAARRQTHGRGRGDHQWYSPPGGLYYSLLLKIPPDRPATDLVFAAGVALAETVLHFGQPKEELALKWPNDLLIGEKKVAGILAELENQHVILGIGVNLSTPAAEFKKIPALFPPASLNQFLNSPTPEIFAQKLSERIQTKYEHYQELGFSYLQEEWTRHCPWIGRQLKLGPGAALASGQVVKEAEWQGKMVGIDTDGALVLLDGTRELHLVSAEILCCLP